MLHSFSSVYGCPEPPVTACMFSYVNGTQVSLAGMTLPEEYAYEYLTKDTVYYINVCGSTTKGGCRSGTQMCQQNVFGSYSCGMTDSQLSIQGPTANFIYGEGDSCASSSRETTVFISCDYSTSGRVESVTETSPCKYEVEMLSLYACP